MLEYSISAVNNLFDFIKRLIYIFQIAIQLVYIMFLVYMIVTGSGNLIGNIILLALSSIYILYQVITTKEFYTKKQISQKTTVKWVVKIAKYAINVYVIATAAFLLISGNAENNNAAMLITILMLFGLLTSFIFDVILLLIDKQVALVNYAFKYDVEKFTENHKLASNALSAVGIDLKNEFPRSNDKKAEKKIKDINHNQKQKQMRKRDFKKSIKK